MNQEKWIAKRMGKRLRQLRQEHGWSQEAFAAEARLDRTYVGGIERGERNPSLKNIARLADTLNVPITRLFEPASPKGHAGPR
jgi:transcriptional regulator with XRE-family HTH domain